MLECRVTTLTFGHTGSGARAAGRP